MSEKGRSQNEISDEWKMFLKDTFTPTDFISRMEEYARKKPEPKLMKYYESNIEWARSLPPMAKIRWRRDEIEERFIPYQIEDNGD
jgi:hypothetical protein